MTGSNVRPILTDEQFATLREAARVLRKLHMEIESFQDTRALEFLENAYMTILWTMGKFGPFWEEGCQGASEGRTGDV